MAELATGHGPVLARYAGETIAAGGKRLRPLLVCIAAGAPPPETDGLVRAAVAVELVHGATLVHDDVLDGSPLRRGRPTVVAAGGRHRCHRDGRSVADPRIQSAARGDQQREAGADLFIANANITPLIKRHRHLPDYPEQLT